MVRNGFVDFHVSYTVFHTDSSGVFRDEMRSLNLFRQMALSKDDIKEKDEDDIRKPIKKMGWVNEDEEAGDKRYDANVRDFLINCFGKKEVWKPYRSKISQR